MNSPNSSPPASGRPPLRRRRQTAALLVAFFLGLGLAFLACDGAESGVAQNARIGLRGSEGVASPGEAGSYVIVKCERGDLEGIRQLLFGLKEYPVKYGPQTMRYFASLPHFYDMCLVAREVLPDEDPSDVSTAAESDGEDPVAADSAASASKAVLGKVVAVVGAAESSWGSANVMMVGVDPRFRRKGIAREMLLRVLESASRIAKERKPTPRKPALREALLHVWISQIPPLSLYMSLGFEPVALLPDYYSSQRVAAGFEMHLPLPYERVEDRLVRKVAKQGGLSLAADSAGALSPLRVVQVGADRDSVEAQVEAFVNAYGGDKRQDALKAVFDGQDVSHRTPAFAAVEVSGKVCAVGWLQVKEEGVAVPVVLTETEADKDGLAFLSVSDALLSAASKDRDLRVARQEVKADEIARFLNLWKLGFRPKHFLEISDPQSRGWWGPRSEYAYSVQVSLPWQRSEELALIEKSGLLGRRLARAKELLDASREAAPTAQVSEREATRGVVAAPSSPSSQEGLATTALQHSKSPAAAVQREPPAVAEGKDDETSHHQGLRDAAAAPPLEAAGSVSSATGAADGEETLPASSSGVSAEKASSPLQQQGPSSSLQALRPSTSSSDAVSSSEEEWYRTPSVVFAVGLFSLVFLFAVFRRCAKKDARRAAVGDSSLSVVRSADRRNGNSSEAVPYKREDEGVVGPFGKSRKTRYARVGDVPTEAELASTSVSAGDRWWGVEDLETFRSEALSQDDEIQNL